MRDGGGGGLCYTPFIIIYFFFFFNFRAFSGGGSVKVYTVLRLKRLQGSERVKTFLLSKDIKWLLITSVGVNTWQTHSLSAEQTSLLRHREGCCTNSYICCRGGVEQGKVPILLKERGLGAMGEQISCTGAGVLLHRLLQLL